MNIIKSLSKQEKKVLLFCCSAAGLTLFGYAFARSTINTLFKVEYGTDNLLIATAMMPFAVFAIVFTYNKILSKFGPQKTLVITTLGSGMIISSLVGLLYFGFSPAAWGLLLFKDGYIVCLIEQYWSLVNSNFTQKKAKKIYGLILAITQIGSVLGSYTIYKFIPNFGTHAMAFTVGVICLPAAYLGYKGYQHSREIQESSTKVESEDNMGIHLFKKHKGLRYLLFVVLFSQIFISFVSLNFQTVLHNSIPVMDEQTKWSGGFFTLITSMSFFLQFIIAPFVLRFTPVVLYFILIPVICLICSLYSYANPSLISVASCFFAFKVMDYSLFRISKEVCYIPYEFDVRYRAKQIIDVLGYRIGKGLPGILGVFAKTGLLALTSNIYIGLSLVAGTVWLCTGIGTANYFRKKNKEALN